MQNSVKDRISVAEHAKNTEPKRESNFLRTAKKSARRNADALRELAKY